jgi:hypothetical protein
LGVARSSVDESNVPVVALLMVSTMVIAKKAGAGSEKGAPTKDSSATNGAQDKLSAGFNGDDIGMTTESQWVIQAFFKMLGQADGPTDDEKLASKPVAKADETEQPSSAGNA